jgi:hypothetical protein
VAVGVSRAEFCRGSVDNKGFVSEAERLTDENGSRILKANLRTRTIRIHSD